MVKCQCDIDCVANWPVSDEDKNDATGEDLLCDLCRSIHCGVKEAVRADGGRSVSVPES